MTTTLNLDTRADRCSNGFAQVHHDGGLCTCPGLALKSAGQARTLAAHPDDRAKVEAAIRQLAATGHPFSANSARAIHNVRGGVVGAVFSALASEGLIRRVGYVASTDPGTHAHPIAEWIGTQAAAA
jgi:hypothetical protein